MTEPALKFNTNPIDHNYRGNILLHFREQGFAIVPNVFERDSVDAFLEQITAAVEPLDGWPGRFRVPEDSPLGIWPVRAPQVRDILSGAFLPWIIESQPVLHHPSWIVQEAKSIEEAAKFVPDWHKDSDHIGNGQHGVYVHPLVVHVVFYLTDMTEAHGPTYVIPRSHRDQSLSPYAGTAEVPLLPKKGDIAIWDQRTWHRSSPRTVPGLRVAGIFRLLHAVPIYRQPLPMTKAQREAWESATDPQEQILFGGAFERSVD